MSAVNAAASSASTVRTLEDLNKTRNTGSKSLGQEEFLKILVAQMSHQDPLEPTGNAEFLAQLAQFTMLEQIKEMGQSFSTSQAYSMIGKYVYVQDGENLIFGKVDGVVRESGISYLMIGGETYDATSVAGVMDGSALEASLGQEMLQSANLIGCTVTAMVSGEDGNAGMVTGQVNRIVVRDGAVYAVVDGHDIPVSNITEIA